MIIIEEFNMKKQDLFHGSKQLPLTNKQLNQNHLILKNMIGVTDWKP